MDFTDHTLSQLISRHFPDLESAPRFRPIRTGKFNTSYWVQAGRQEMVLRIAPDPRAGFVFYERNMMRQEPDLHALLRAQTNIPVAEILVFDDSHALIERDYMLMQRLPGIPLTEAPSADTKRVFYQVGRYLAQAHSLQAEQYGYLGAHHPMRPMDTWAQAFRTMWEKMIEDIAAQGYYNAQECSYLRGLLENNLQIFDRPVPACLLHMDIWHQNILVDNYSKVTGILDWDRAMWGDPEIEFAVLDYCGVSEPPFWEGYGQERDRSPEAQTRRIFYLLYEIQKYILIRHARNQDPAGALHYKEQVQHIVRSFAS